MYTYIFFQPYPQALRYAGRCLHIYLRRCLIITLAMQQNPISSERYLHLSVHTDYGLMICHGDKVSIRLPYIFSCNFDVLLESEVDYLK